MNEKEAEKIKEYSNLNNYYLKISLDKNNLSLIGLNTENLDDILYQFSITDEEIKQNITKYKNQNLTELFDKIIALIDKGKYMIIEEKHCISLSLFEGENFDINKDLQFFLIKSTDQQSEAYQKAMKTIIKSLKKQCSNAQNQILDLQLDLQLNKAQSEDLTKKPGNMSKSAINTFKKSESKDIEIPKQANNTKRAILKEGIIKIHGQNINNFEQYNRSYKKRKTNGLNISALASLNYDSYPMVELSPTSFNIISAYGGNSYNGTARKYNEDRIKIITDYKLPKPVTKKNGEKIDPKINYFAIYDGHGGEKCCNFLQENLHNNIFSSEFFPLYLAQAVKKAYAQTEDAFYDTVFDAENGKLLDKSGSCAVSVLMMDEFCFVINLGDSRALYSFDSGNQLMQVTRDHKPNDPIEKERIEKAGGKVHKEDKVKIKGQLVKLDEKKLPPGVKIPYRVIPGNIAVRK